MFKPFRAWPCKDVKNTEIPLPMWNDNDCSGWELPKRKIYNKRNWKNGFILNLSFGLKEKSKIYFIPFWLYVLLSPDNKTMQSINLQRLWAIFKTIYKQVKKLNIRQIFTGIYSYIRQYCYYWVLSFLLHRQVSFIISAYFCYCWDCSSW